MLTIPIKLASLLVLVNGSLLFLAGICMSGRVRAQGLLAPGARGAARTVTVDYAAQGRPVSTFWAQFGYDEPNYTYMKDGRKPIVGTRTDGVSGAALAVQVRLPAHGVELIKISW